MYGLAVEAALTAKIMVASEKVLGSIGDIKLNWPSTQALRNWKQKRPSYSGRGVEVIEGATLSVASVTPAREERQPTENRAIPSGVPVKIGPRNWR